MKQKVSAIFDIGKTNKKIFIFDEGLGTVRHEEVSIPEIEDEDGYPTEDLDSLTRWIQDCVDQIKLDKELQLEAINFSAYGASLVHLDRNDRVCAPLYNYSKPLSAEVEAHFFDRYQPIDDLSVTTGSPFEGMLNSGIQLYWLKHFRPELYGSISRSVHLPQYLSYLFSGKLFSDFTSIGCHTALWDYVDGDYHRWVKEEKIIDLLPAICPTNRQVAANGFDVGVGIHDSSAALLPYFELTDRPFLLISTGTWFVTLNPFSEKPLTKEDLKAGCLNYMQPSGRAVKASRLFLGREHDNFTETLAHKHQVSSSFFRELPFERSTYLNSKDGSNDERVVSYYRFVDTMVSKLLSGLAVVSAEKPINTIFVDGGFVNNKVFLGILSVHLGDQRLQIADSARGSALGARLVGMKQPLDRQVLRKKMRVQDYRESKDSYN